MRYPALHKILLGVLAAFLFLSAVPSFAEELNNLEILFKKSYWDWDPDSIVYFGSAICSAGDLNGDGYDDIAAVGWDYEPVAGWRALIFVFFGGEPIDTVPDIILGDDYWGGLGMSSLAGGDVNGDGFSDIVIGLPYGPGNVEVYFGGDPMDTVADLCIFEDPPEYYFGRDVATGDINGDGYLDIVATDYFNGSGRGAAYVYYGGPLLDHIPDVTLRGHGAEGFGISVGSGGDVNSDGYDDIVVGAWVNDERYYDAGKIYVYYGGDPMDTIYDVGMCGERPVNCLGWQPVDIVEDSSGYDYVVAATMFWPYGFPNMCPGKLYVLFGGDPMDSIPDLWMHGQTDSSRLGIVSSAGDVNGDGVEDVIGGAVREYGRTGTVYLWLGGPGMDTLPDAWMRGTSDFYSVGYCVSTAGDVDGDGRDELLFSNYAAGTYWHTVWVCKYTGTGIGEEHPPRGSGRPHAAIACSPNPFRDGTVIEVSAPAIRDHTEGRVSLAIHDTAGRLVKSFDIAREAERFTWDGRDEAGRDLPSGVYFLSVTPEQTAPPVKLTLMR
jgi:hypothetical protein